MNEPNSTANPNSSLQAGLATPPETSINSPDITDGPGFNTIAKAQAPNQTIPKLPQVMPPAENMTPASRGNCKKKFYVVTRGRRTGVFDNWQVNIDLS